MKALEASDTLGSANTSCWSRIGELLDVCQYKVQVMYHASRKASALFEENSTGQESESGALGRPGLPPPQGIRARPRHSRPSMQSLAAAKG